MGNMSILLLFLFAMVVALVLSIIALVIALVALSRTRAAAAQPAPVGASLATPFAAAPPTPAKQGAASDAPANAADQPIAAEILAAIAAAVSMVCGPGARIASVQTAAATAADPTAQLWALEGRRAVHSTHRPR